MPYQGAMSMLLRQPSPTYCTPASLLVGLKSAHIPPVYLNDSPGNPYGDHVTFHVSNDDVINTALRVLIVLPCVLPGGKCVMITQLSSLHV